MAIDNLFENGKGCTSCGAPSPALAPSTNNPQWYIKDGTWWLGDYNSGQLAKGNKGDQGFTPYIGGNNNWWINGVDTGFSAEGSKPDDEDLINVGTGSNKVLKLKNRSYNPSSVDGRGYVILRKNMVGGVNLLRPEMLGTVGGTYTKNTTYIVRYDFVLESWIRVGDGTRFVFEGGSIRTTNDSQIVNEEGSVVNVNTSYSVDLTDSNKSIQTNVFRNQYLGGGRVSGGKTFVSSKVGWLNVNDYGIIGDGVTDVTVKLNALLNSNSLCPPDSVVYFPRGIYKITDTITVFAANVTLKGDDSGFDDASNLSVGDYVADFAVFRGVSSLWFTPTFTGANQEKIMINTGVNNFKINYDGLCMIASTWRQQSTEDYANGPTTGVKHRNRVFQDPTLLANNNKVSACSLVFGVMTNCNIFGFNGVGVYHAGYTAKIQSSRIGHCGTGVKTMNFTTKVWVSDSLLENVYISRCGIGIHASYWLIIYGLWMDEISEYGILQDQVDGGGVTYDLSLEIVGGHFNHIDYAAIKSTRLNNTQIFATMNRCGCYYAGYTYAEVPTIDKDKCCQIFVSGATVLSQIHIKNTEARVGDIVATRGGFCIASNIVSGTFNRCQIFVNGFNTSNLPYVLTGSGSTDAIFYWFNKKYEFVLGNTLLDRANGTTAQRPVLQNFASQIGYQYFDTTLGKVVYWKGLVWVDGSGTTV